MKKAFVLFALITATVLLYGQQQEIIYRDFEPDTVLHIGNPEQYLMWIDFDNDNLSDLKIEWVPQSTGPFVNMSGRDDNVKLYKAEEGDTIMHLMDWWEGTSYPHLHEQYGIRIEKNGDFYYGWFRVYNLYEPYVINAFCFDKFAFCTIPNYPLRWGQTSLSADVNESNGNKLATIHPNPTNGVFNVTGENLKRIEIYDVLGQKVLSLNVNDDCTNIDLGPHPAGIYLINVTDQHGRSFTAKIVKQ